MPEGNTLRESLESAMDGVLNAPDTVQEPKITESSQVDAAQTEEKPGRTANRSRDEKGRLLPGKTEVKAEVKAQQPLATSKPRPTAWKKDFESHWTKIANETPDLADYLHQREADYAKGVSMYKGEWERAKPYLEAMAPFMPLLQQHGIEPTQWIGNLGNAHRMLSQGSAQDKVAMFRKLASDYGVPVEQLFTRGNDGQFYWNQNAPQVQPNLERLVQDKMQDYITQQEIAKFSSDNERFPHFETVRATMAGLLQSGLANDLESAYLAALRMPQHSDIWEQMQQQQMQADAEKRKAEERAKVEKARAQTISTRSATPSANANGNGKKGLRETLSETVDQVLGGRV